MSAVEDVIVQFVYDDDSGQKQFYLPGDTLRGSVHVHLRGDLRVNSIVLMIFGGAALSWEVVGKKKIYSAREEYLQGSKVLLDSGPLDSLVLSKGIHFFSFQYELPWHLPSSFTGVYGSISYLVKVVLDTEDERSSTMTSEPFMVLRRPPLPHYLFRPQELKSAKTFFGLCTAGQVNMKCRISRSAAIPGEVIFVSSLVTNMSERGVTMLQGSIVRESTFYAQNSQNKKIVMRETINKRIDVFDVVSLRGRFWRNVQMTVPPYLADSGLDGCSIMDVKYFLEFRAQVEGRNDILVQFPLYVGGLPEGYWPYEDNLDHLQVGHHGLPFVTQAALPWDEDLESISVSHSGMQDMNRAMFSYRR